jgi:hypothetical protein
VSSRFNSAASWAPYAGPGGWNDYDSLQLGNGDKVGLTADQRRSHFTLWAMAASPLLLGTDLTALDATDMAMLTNDRLIAVDQDGVAARRVVNDGSRQVFSKREANGDYVIALFNTATSGSTTVSVTFSQVGFSGSAAVTNLWSGASEGTRTNSYSVSLRPGETRLIRAKPTTSGGSTVEAESGTLAGAARLATCAACSGGQKVGYIGNGAANYVTVNGVTPSAAGSRQLTITYLLSGSRSFFVSVNGGAGVEVPLTGTSFATPATTTITVTLNAGANAIRFYNNGAYAPDLDKVSVN